MNRPFVLFLVLVFSLIFPQLSFADHHDLTEVSKEAPQTCLALPPAKVKTALDQVNEVFGTIVDYMGTVLFWEPFSFVVEEANGQPKMAMVSVLDEKQKSHSSQFPIQEVNHRGEVENQYSLCLNDNGLPFVNDKGLPWVTEWTLQEGSFVHAPAVVLENKNFAVSEKGAFLFKTKTMQKMGSEPERVGFPLVVLILSLGALFYTIYYGFINFRLFKHAIDCVRGVFDNPDDPGEVSHFQALTAALSATVGLGNIAGVAVAVSVGGPGAVFWMVLFGLLGMTSKFHECTLGQLYRWIDDEGHVHGGPMHYLARGFKDLKLGSLGSVLAVIFALFIIGGSFGAGNMFQANQSFKAIAGEIPALAPYGFGFGLGLAFLVGLVIIGGIRRIGVVTEKLIPIMCAIYVVAGLYVVAIHISEFPRVMALIFSEAFNFQAGLGGFSGIAIQGIRRSVF